MQEYQKHGIENHPTISVEYVRFLVTHSGQGSIAQFKRDLAKLETSVDELASVAKAAQSTAGTALNRAEEAKKLAAKK